MDVKPGYKQTEAGVIPCEWEVRKLASVCREPMQNGVFYKPSLKGTGVKLINVGDLYRHTPIDTDSLELFDANESERERFKVEDGDLFFTRSSVVPSGIAHCNIYTSNRPESVVFDSHVIRVRPDPEQINPSYFYRYCVSSAARRYLISHAKTAIMTTIDQGVLGNCPVLLPSKAEQRAIAEALSDVDALISALDRLIAKKRAIKQGAMQELLTGRRRLPGFDGDWKVKRMGEIAEVVMGQSPSSLHYNSKGQGLPLIQGNADIFNRQTIKRIFTTEVTKIGRQGDILMSVRAPVGEISRASFDVCLGRGVCALRYQNDFLYHGLIAKESDWGEFSKGSTFDSVNSSDVKAFEIHLPIDPIEQEAIAAILSDMDAEIAALEQRRDKTKLLKQGMMQELLTGKTRLL